jgi:hypothetical protein
MAAGVLGLVTLLVAAPGDGLVGTPEQRPSELELPLLFGAGHRQDHAPHFRYRGRD